MSQRVLTTGTFMPFEQLIKGESVYIDKTGLICKLARRYSSYIQTGPRGMGKSTLISTLEYLFSKGTEGTEGLACHELWKDPYRYFVMHLDWSSFNVNAPGGFKTFFINKLKRYVDFFGLSIDSELDEGTIFETLVRDILSKLADKSFLEQHPELSQGDRPLRTDWFVLLIDEYDAPLSRHLDNKQVFEEFIALYHMIFATIKSIGFRLVFITGASSDALTSLGSSANQFKNISLRDRDATCCGYTHDELEKYMKPELEHAQEVLKLSHDELMERLTNHYGAYLCSRDYDDAKRVFCPVSVSRFLQCPENGFQAY